MVQVVTKYFRRLTGHAQGLWKVTRRQVLAQEFQPVIRGREVVFHKIITSTLLLLFAGMILVKRL